MEITINQLQQNLFLIAGPCVIESEELCLEIAEKCLKVSQKFNITYIFKASYDKANRSSISSFRGPGIEKGLRILNNIKNKLNIPILTDIHSPKEAKIAGEVVDILQIPAFLCRQTDLLISAGETQKWVNIKKGQFIAPWDMKNVVEKVLSTGNNKIMLTERGTFFGYNNLVNDMRALVIMKQLAPLVVFDATHSVQLPGAGGSCSSGRREFIPYLARAATAVGINGLFIETHPNPDSALCDGANSLRLSDMEELVKQVVEIHEIVKKIHR